MYPLKNSKIEEKTLNVKKFKLILDEKKLNQRKKNYFGLRNLKNKLYIA